MPEIEIRLRPVFGHKYFAVFIGADRPRIDIDVRIQFLRSDFQPARFQQSPEARRSDALSQAGNDAARHKNILCHLFSPNDIFR